MEAAFTGHADQLKTLLAQDKCSGKVTAPDEAGMGPIHLCALRGQVECATILLDVEPNRLHAADTRGRTPLVLAATGGSVEMIKLLIARGADVNGGCDDGKRALHWAVLSHRPAAVEALVKAGAHLHLRDKPPKLPMPSPATGERMRGRTALDLAGARHGKHGDPVLEFIKEYLQRCQDGETPSIGTEPWIDHALRGRATADSETTGPTAAEPPVATSAVLGELD